jgi:hypothetical protein
MQKFRILLTVFLSLLILFPACKNEPQTFEEELRHVFKGTRGFYYVKIPPALLNLVLKASDDKEMIDFFGNARQVGIISFGKELSEGKNLELVKDLDQMLEKYEFEELIRISDSGRLVTIKIREHGGSISDLVAIISQNPGTVTGITLSGEIDIQTIIKLAAEMDFDKLMQLQEIIPEPPGFLQQREP